MHIASHAERQSRAGSRIETDGEQRRVDARDLTGAFDLREFVFAVAARLHYHRARFGAMKVDQSDHRLIAR